MHLPEGGSLPPQGWKIHVSACLDNAERRPRRRLGLLRRRIELAFKFIRSPRRLLLRNSKYADRGASGKFVTIYPRDEAQLEMILTELGELLDGAAGPYILSDLRWGDGPLYVRYGGFAERYCVGADGKLELAIADAAASWCPTGAGRSSTPPAWVTLPAFLAAAPGRPATATVGDLPYRSSGPSTSPTAAASTPAVDRRTGEQVVLKEARPHAGLDADGADAVDPAGAASATCSRGWPASTACRALHDEFTLGEHHVPRPWSSSTAAAERQLVERYPLRRPTRRRGGHRATYTRLGARDLRPGGAGRGGAPRARRRLRRPAPEQHPGARRTAAWC